MKCFFCHDETVEFMMRSLTFESNNCNNVWRITWHLIALIWPSDFYCEELKRWKGAPTHARAHTRNRRLHSDSEPGSGSESQVGSLWIDSCLWSGKWLFYWLLIASIVKVWWLTACFNDFCQQEKSENRNERRPKPSEGSLTGVSDWSLTGVCEWPLCHPACCNTGHMFPARRGRAARGPWRGWSGALGPFSSGGHRGPQCGALGPFMWPPFISPLERRRQGPRGPPKAFDGDWN